MTKSVGEEAIVLMQGLRMLEKLLRRTLSVGKEVNTIHGMKIGAKKKAIML
jgi:hypothetical protein